MEVERAVEARETPLEVVESVLLKFKFGIC